MFGLPAKQRDMARSYWTSRSAIERSVISDERFQLAVKEEAGWKQRCPLHAAISLPSVTLSADLPFIRIKIGQMLLQHESLPYAS
jgi:hypothetical protein